MGEFPLPPQNPAVCPSQHLTKNAYACPSRIPTTTWPLNAKCDESYLKRGLGKRPECSLEAEIPSVFKHTCRDKHRHSHSLSSLSTLLQAGLRLSLSLALTPSSTVKPRRRRSSLYIPQSLKPRSICLRPLETSSGKK
ncbi:hypothetical protein SK128_028406, partial [Halocaridina rubra]